MNTSRNWRSPGIIAWSFLVFCVVVLLGLGTWQVQRLQWKTNLIETIEQANETPPRQGFPQSRQQQEALGWQRVAIEGEYLHEHEFHLAARYYKNQVGYHILTPFRLKDGRVVLLNRGWVPPELKDPSLRKQGQIEGPQQIIAMVRTDKDYNAFTPEGDPKDNLWFRRNIERMSEVSGLNLEPVTLDVLYTEPPGGFPVASVVEVNLRNDHLGYAITWYSLAVAAIVIFILFHRRPEKEE
jgi:surfeit locus 1 family protein